MENLPDVLTPEMLMDILKIGRNTIYNLLRSGAIRSVRIGRQYRIPRDALTEYLEGGERRFSGNS